MVRYAEFNERMDDEEIEKILKNYFLIGGSFSINNGSIDVEGNVTLHRYLTEIPIKFGKVSGSFRCNNTKITTLAGSPSVVGENFDCSDNRLISLEGSPHTIMGDFDCSNNQITSFVDGPKIVNGFYEGFNNVLASVEGLPEQLKNELYLNWNKNLPLLRLLKYRLVMIYDNTEVKNIMKKYCELGFSRSSLIACQRELIDAGFEGNARW